MSTKTRSWYWYSVAGRNEERIKELEKQVEELKEGACRFNCRTAKENFMAGHTFGLSQPFSITAKEAWDEYKKSQEE